MAGATTHTVGPVGHSYGAFLTARYLWRKGPAADRYLIMAGRLDMQLMYAISRMQIEGYCVQSRTRANRAFLVDYFSTDDSIFMVVHNSALQECG